MINSFSQYLEKLNRSFGALFRLVERPRDARNVVVALLVIHTALLAYSAYVHSPTLNEPGHLVAGLSHWKFGRFELYRNNPPLVRMVAALPVMAVGYSEDWSGFWDGPGAMPQFAMGEDFVAANGKRSFFLFMVARWACIPFSWLGAIVCYLWARDLYGRPAGVVACSIWCFEPNILAHASVIAPDAHAAAFGLAACYTFWRWLRNPTWSQAAWTGLVLGLAELTKTTLILFYPLWPIMWAAYRWPDRSRMSGRDWLREAAMLVVRMAIGLYVVNLGYGFESTLRALGNFHFVSDMLTGAEARGTDATDLTQDVARSESLANRFADSWLGAIPVPLPANYLLGIDIQQRDFEHLGRPSYLRGEWRDRGWWYYYIYAAGIKVPLGLWLIGVFLLIRTLIRRKFHTNRRHLLQRRDTLILLLPAFVILTVASLKTGINEHMRYVLPAFPFMFIWISRWGENFIDFRIRNAIHSSVAGASFQFLAPLMLLLLMWSTTSSLWAFPHSLSYFNESIGGPIHGPDHLLGSNVDWGQDLRYVVWARDRIRSENERLPFYLACHALIDPADVGLSEAEAWPFFHGETTLTPVANVKPLPLGAYTITVNLLKGSPMNARDGHGTSYMGYGAILGLRIHLNRCQRIGYSLVSFTISTGLENTNYR